MKKSITLGRLKRFIATPTQERAAFVEAFWLLCVARIAVLFLPFKTLASRIGVQMKETSNTPVPEDAIIVASISRAVKKAALYTPCRSQCMEQALAASIMLKRKKLTSTIYFGVQKGEGNNEKLKAHAWIRSGDTIVTGAQGHKQFDVVAYFGG